MNQSKFLSSLFISSMLLTSPLIASAADASNENQALSAGQVTQVKKVVHDYLVTNPQVLVEASMALQKQEVQKVEAKSQEAIVSNARQIFADAASPIAGNPQGDVTVVEFFDYQCPHCKDMRPVLEKLLATDKNVRVVFKELPIFGASSRDASAAALAAQKQGADKYLKLHEALLATDNPLNKDKIMKAAQSVGLDTTKLAKDMNSTEVKKQLDDNFKLAQALGLMGTPTFIISQWKVGAEGNSAKNAQFIPGIVTAEKLQQLVAQSR